MAHLKLIALYAVPSIVCFANDNSAYIPEMWAMESLAILEESMVMSNLVHRDFNDEVKNFGDVVNTRRPNKFNSSRKTDLDSVVAQDAISTNVQVKLDQHHYNTFMIKDGEGSKSFMDLREIYLKPAVQAVGRGVDRSVIGQAHRFLRTNSSRVGGLLTGSSANVRSRVVECREKLNVANVPQDGQRHLVVAPGTESDMLNTDLFVRVNESGSSSALRAAQVGNLFGFGIYAANNASSVGLAQTDIAEGTVTSAVSAGAAAAATPVTITGYVTTVGEWFTIEGDDQPKFAVAVASSAGNTTSVTPNEAVKFSTSASAAITVSRKFQSINAYAAGYSKELVVGGYTNAPVAGRMISIGTGGARKDYSIIEAYVNPSNGAQTIILLDRPLEIGVAASENLFPMPAGEYNLAFHRNALSLVTRPLALPMSGSGVLAATAALGNLSMRICMQYDGKEQGTRVTVDMLSGVALLDATMGTLFLS